MKIRKSIILLVILMLATSGMTACSGAGKDTDETAGDASVVSDGAGDGETAEAVEEKTITDIVSEKYAGIDLDGYKYHVLAPAAGEHFYFCVDAGINEVYAEEMNGSLINDAIWQRNNYTMELLNVSINPVWATGNVEGITSQLNKEVLSGETLYDTVLNRMDYMGTSMINGDLLNIHNIQTLDTTNPWWDKNIVDTFTVFGDKLYFISGDINIFDDFAVEVIYFNKQLCDDNGLAYPYSDVTEGTWTIAKFYEMAKAVEQDLNGDGKLIPEDDVVGHCEHHTVIHWMYAMGEKSIIVGEDSKPIVDLTSERHIQAVDTIFQYMFTGQGSYVPAVSASNHFVNGTVLFAGDMLGPINTLRDMSHSFGVLPMPKMNEEQENYGNYISNGWTTVYGVPMTNSSNADKIGTILEVLCGYSTDTLRTALYDVLFAAKLVRDAESVEMLDIIFSSKSYDWAVDFSWGGTILGIYGSLNNSSGNTYSSTIQSKLGVIESEFADVFTKIQALEY